ncbi:fungal-specific transcription factor domain-containing protein [Podospora didyma]|uniref:Fungal-specific transcription factor domain-containing protein n=1 Tax=Podospora didyma TaxID=330526 RepID=A0AAE0K5U7_9PEZI|nr:fungal-specific transcription factor domain-containing protein [Podospora didyma]
MTDVITVTGSRSTMGSEALAQEQAMPSQTSKRLTCESCRDRKIRCDRQHPSCGRCAKMGIQCHYSSRAKPAPSKKDLSRYLQAINSRLQQAEAQLAYRSLAQSPLRAATLSSDEPFMQTPSTHPIVTSLASISPSFASSTMPPALGLSYLGMTPAATQPGMAMDGWPDIGIDSFDFDLGLVSPAPFEYDSGLFPLTPNSKQTPNYQVDPSFEESPLRTNQIIPGLPRGFLQRLHDRYFEVFHPIQPIISRRRFERETSQPSPSIGVLALSCAMAALASTSIPERCHVDKCYEQCRTLLDACERDETGESLASINTLQALTLMALYEVKQPNFVRAWMTLGRAIRLAKMMGLDCASDACRKVSGVGTVWGRAQARLKLPPPTAADAEERRRTFWMLFVLDATSVVYANDGSALEVPMHVPVASSGDYPDGEASSMPSIDQIFDSDVSTISNVTFSPFAATAVVVCLVQRCMGHITTCHHPSKAHHFWETHFAIDKTIKHCRATSLAPHTISAPQSPQSLVMRMNLDALEISLHETALLNIQDNKLPAALATETRSRCAWAAADIAHAVQRGRQLTGNHLEMFRQHDRFLVWPLTTAIRTGLRMLDDKDEAIGSKSLLPSQLRELSRAVEELISPEHVPPGLLDNTLVMRSWSEEDDRRAVVEG